jgi:dihydroneopterin aldolase
VDTIFVTDLRVETIVGIWEWERQVPQTVRIDLEMAADIQRAAASDSIEATLDYRAVAKRIAEFVAESRYKLIESMAEGIADVIVGEFDVPWVKVSVHKPWAVRGSKDVGIVIERGDR